MKSNNNTYRLIALTMAFVMFASSVNLAIDMHYCQGQLKSFSFFGKAKTCHEVMATMKSCPHHQKMMTEKKSENEGCSRSIKDCCDNKSLHIQSDLDQINSSTNFVVNQELQQFVIALVKVFITNNSIENSTTDFQYYKPPIVSKDYSVLFQSFLI